MTAYIYTRTKYTFKCFRDLFVIEQITFLQTFPIDVLNGAVYSTFIGFSQSAQIQKIFKKNHFTNKLFIVAMETLISIIKISFKTFIQDCHLV